MLSPIIEKYLEMGFAPQASQLKDLQNQFQKDGMPSAFPTTIENLKPGSLLFHPQFVHAPVERRLIVGEMYENLTRVDNLILFELVTHTEELCRYEDLSKKCLGNDTYCDSDRRTLSKHVSTMRHILRGFGVDPSFIVSQASEGFRLQTHISNPTAA